MSGQRIKIHFWGVRGSIPAPGDQTLAYGGNTACVSFQIGDEYVVLDAGSGIRLFGKHLVDKGCVTGNKIHLFISHTHWDHIQGLPFFAAGA